MVVNIVPPSAASKVSSRSSARGRYLASQVALGGGAVLCNNISTRMNFCITKACGGRECQTGKMSVAFSAVGFQTKFVFVSDGWQYLPLLFDNAD